MTITCTNLHDEHEGHEGHEGHKDEPVRPFDAFCPLPSPLSDDVEEIVAYMLLIGDRHRRPGATAGPVPFRP